MISYRDFIFDNSLWIQRLVVKEMLKFWVILFQGKWISLILCEVYWTLNKLLHIWK